MSLSSQQVRATVAVSDISRASEFYERTLGLTPLRGDEMADVRIYPCGSASLLQVYASEHAARRRRRSRAGAPTTSSRWSTSSARRA